MHPMYAKVSHPVIIDAVLQWQYIIMEGLLNQYGSIEGLFEVSVAVRLRNRA